MTPITTRLDLGRLLQTILKPLLRHSLAASSAGLMLVTALGCTHPQRLPTNTPAPAFVPGTQTPIVPAQGYAQPIIQAPPVVQQPQVIQAPQVMQPQMMQPQVIQPPQMLPPQVIQPQMMQPQIIQSPQAMMQAPIYSPMPVMSDGSVLPSVYCPPDPCAPVQFPQQ